MVDFNFNLNDAARSFDVISDNTVCTVQLTIKPGGAGAGGWLTSTTTAKGYSEYLNSEFVVVDEVHAKRKFWTRFIVHGDNHADAIRISRETLRAFLESARGIRPDDNSDAAQVARTPKGWEDFDGLRFVVRVGVEPPKDGYSAKNKIKDVITPERKDWTKAEQVDRSQLANRSNGNAAPTPDQAPANTIARPNWAKD